MVTGSASSPITIASLGGAAMAAGASTSARSTSPIPHARRLVIPTSLGEYRGSEACCR